MTKILVINANPKSNSFCKSLAEQYTSVAADKHDVEQIHIGDLNFKISLDEGYSEITTLEPDLLDFQNKVQWSEHIVIISPVWWGAMPAKFKGAIDRTFLPGFSFKYLEGKSIPQKLLKGRTSQLIITLDTPPLWYKLIYGNPIYKQLKHTILEFCGIKNTSSTYFGPMISASSKHRKNWLDKTARLASQIK
ncbi:NAD(P)H-dependent oxidoreductase [Vibrio ruber]|uniref:NAD(P)H-dependent oxidoreductase n=1 Tax=Vibrio ruber TaxID=184755 RepID=UPI0028930E84|nr:NAD(P)H-dependent oxidoreductase [Vibrio ruber]WNJ97763.1 NAD(P)H-dependent oxidoreductase [Vibrio ruber]